MAYAEKLRDPRWQKKRLRILDRDSFTCQLCKDTETELHVHHTKYSGDPWNGRDSDLITYCKFCHAIVEYIKKDKHLAILSVMKRSLDYDDRTVFICIVYNSIISAKEMCVILFRKNVVIEGLHFTIGTLKTIIPLLSTTP